MPAGAPFAGRELGSEDKGEPPRREGMMLDDEEGREAPA